MKQPYAARLKQVKADLTKYKKLSKEQHSQAARSDLLSSYNKSGSSNSDDPYGERSDRTRLLAGTETLNDGSRRIVESTSLALETETHGADILRTLRGQREQIENSRNMVRFPAIPLQRMLNLLNLSQLTSADTHIDRASGTLKGMIRQYASVPFCPCFLLTLLSLRMHKQRFILSGIGVFFVVLVLTILYFKLFRR